RPKTMSTSPKMMSQRAMTDTERMLAALVSETDNSSRLPAKPPGVTSLTRNNTLDILQNLERSTKPLRGRERAMAENARPKISRRAFVTRSAGAALAISGVSSFLGSRRAASQTGSGTVVVMAWENYVHPEIQKRFREATGITVRGI